MPELTLVHIGMLAAAVVAGIVLGWIVRGGRNKREKLALNAGWQAQIDSQQTEHDRLAGQNKSLMEQISQYQASNKDSRMRAKELSESLKEAFNRRDELQRQLKDIRGNLEVAITQRDKFKSNVSSSTARVEVAASTLKEKDDNISRLKQELENWQSRVAPLVERYRQRDLEAQQLEVELRKATDHISTLEGMTRGEHTRIQRVDSSSLPEGMDASNEPHDETSLQATQQTVNEEARGQPGDSANDENIDQPSESVDEEAVDDNADLAENVDAVAENPSGSDEDTVFPNILSDDYATGMFAPDDLKQIKGIGPAIAKTLNDLGVHRFSQIAEMSEYDIDRVAQQLKGFRSRIYREDWIGQARTLQRQKNIDSQSD